MHLVLETLKGSSLLTQVLLLTLVLGPIWTDFVIVKIFFFFSSEMVSMDSW